MKKLHIDVNDELMLFGAITLIFGVGMLSIPAGLIVAGLLIALFGAWRDVAE